ncbi:MAG: sensor histidine kinase [Bryobacteraceae bacterium]
MERPRNAARNFVQSIYGRYGLAVLSVIASLLLTRLWLIWRPPLRPSAFFVVGLIVSTMVGGVGPGLLFSLLSVVSVQYFFAEHFTITTASVLTLITLWGMVFLIGKLISARRKAVESLETLNAGLEERVEKRTAELAATVDRLQQEVRRREQVEAALRRSNEELQRFAFIASHDLQEPLRTMSLYAQLLSRRYGDRLDAEGVASVGYICESAQRMQALIQGYMEYSQVERYSGVEDMDAGAVVRHVVSDLTSAVRESGAQVEIGELPLVRANPTLLSRLFQNLLLNSIKYRSERPLCIRVFAEEAGGEWIFTVEDNGIGIPLEYAEQVFVIFKRLHGREREGYGVGLAVCKRIVEHHGGRIWVEPVPDGGTRLRFTLKPANVRRS